ncbi:iron chelate uptake ABC transporter family permease subunit, partial [Streptococcus agalactiae]|nr:iron chelate uptake ABC transporter family permease subunit [Streptococcus agalactiae]MCK6332497.1 iron chelate uptake ABC transporter family permease subunit [Streptococcus agalactiae]
LILFLIGCYASLRFGAINFKTSDLITVLKNPLKNSNAQDVIFDIRLPRIIAAILVGAAMSQAGGLSQINWKMLIIIAPIIILGLLISQLLAHQLTILSLNESVAKALGQKTQLMTAFLLLIVLFLSASSVALIGTVSFIGLIIPHFIKLFIPKDYR